MKSIAACANGLWLGTSLPAWWRFRRAVRRPAEAQREILRTLLRENADCAYGREYGFAGLRSYEEFRKTVPIADYDTFTPWIRRIMQGESAVLTEEPVIRLVPTSGSTAGRKLIPYTAAFQRQLNAAISPWMVDLCREHPTVPLGPAYWSISPLGPSPVSEPSAVPIGFDDDSSYLGGVQQRLAAATFAVPPVLRHIEAIDDARYLTLLCLLRQPELRLISVWHPSFLTLLLDALPAWKEELLADVERGGCLRARLLSPAVQRALSAAPQPHRARALRYADAGQPQTIWRHLRVVSCWGDGQAALAQADLQSRLPGVAIQTKGLLATEAVVTVPFAARHPVAVASHFFEFENSNGEVSLVQHLQPGETYRVIVTTAGGLWRYRLGDLVEVDGFVERTPSLRFLGRGTSTSDMCGEKLAEVFVTKAIGTACTSCGFAPSFAMLAPEATGERVWNYTLFVEGTPPPEMAAQLEKELRTNPNYALCRDLGQLGPLQIFHVRDGYRKFSSTCVSEGRRLGDIKPQALSARTDWKKVFRKES